ncbi:MAG TPA: methyltransferase domain-containing protein [Thermodesulfobacteriota bacterium]|nr:methyltransferase domain-containing protein [Thermodesulfobacteriota bacterium]
MEIQRIKGIYAAWSHLYDHVFKVFFYRRLGHAIRLLDIQPGQRVLDVGVGTGFTLDFYPPHCQVVGIDISREMLRKARQRVRDRGLRHVSLIEMDASRLGFPNDTFDCVVAAHVMSVVPEPIRVLAEIKRVTRQDGKIAIINHFQSTNRVLARLEAYLNPITRRIGWRTDLDLDSLVREGQIDVDFEYKLKRADLWKVVVAVNSK